MDLLYPIHVRAYCTSTKRSMGAKVYRVEVVDMRNVMAIAPLVIMHNPRSSTTVTHTCTLQ